jgi:thiamine biosynthesis lipoprotein
MSTLFALSTALVAVAAPPGTPSQTWAFHLDHVLGTSFDMAVAGAGRAEAEFAFAAATSEIARLDRVLSGWREDSELSALNRAERMQVSGDLFAVLSACETWRTQTGGAFSARLGEAERLSDSAAICAAVGKAEAADVRLDRVARTVVRPEGVRFAVDGLAKGYVIDAALAAARRAAPCADGVMIDIGGDIACTGARDWLVGVADPDAAADNAAPAEVVRLSGRALAVSGPGQRNRLVDGRPHSHLIDPAAGAPAPRRQAAVIAPDAVTADALATAFAVLPRADALALAEATPGVEALLVEGRLRSATSGWARCQAPAPLPAGFQVEVTYVLPRIDAANYKKPFVIVWVTDAEKNPIKTLLIQGTKKDWQEDNYVWWRRYGRKQPGVVEAMGKPTRPPGKYTVGWDGTDASGKRVPQGQYLIHIEAAREHGGHAYQTIPVTLGAAPASAAAPAKDELGAAQARYAKSK